MGAAAEFDRIGIASHRQHAHFVAVFLAKQRHRACCHGIVGRHQPGRDRLVGANLGVHFGFDHGYVFGAESDRVREIEPEAVSGDQRALLRHMAAKPVPQGGVDQVGCRMVSPDRIAPRNVDVELDRITDLDGSGCDFGLVGVQTAQRL